MFFFVFVEGGGWGTYELYALVDLKQSKHKDRTFKTKKGKLHFLNL